MSGPMGDPMGGPTDGPTGNPTGNPTGEFGVPDLPTLDPPANPTPNPTAAGESLLAEIESSADASVEDLGDRDLQAIREFLDSDLYAFAIYVMGFKDLIPSLHGHLSDWIKSWGMVQKLSGEWVYYTQVHPSEPLMRDQRRIITQIPREHFKCRKVGSLVNTPNGVVPVEKLSPGDLVYALDENLVLVTRKVISNVPGTSELVAVTLANGNKAFVTPWHPFLTVGGWVEAGQLNETSAIAVATHIPEPPTPIGPRPYSAGVLCGDGCSANLSLTCFDNEILGAIAAEGTIYHHRSVRGTYGIPKYHWHPELLHGAWTKYIPADYEGSALFLRGLFDTDGTVGKNGVVLVSVSERLIRDTQRNLLYFGIRSAVHRFASQGPNGYRSFAWQLLIGTAEGCRKFQAAIGFTVQRKINNLAIAARRTTSKRTSTRNSAVPPEWRNMLRTNTTGNKSTRGDLRLLRDAGIRVDNPYWTSKDKVVEAAAILRRPDIAKFAGQDVAWESVVSVERVGKHEIAQLEVEGGTYICEGILDHNTSLGTISNALWQVSRTDPDGVPGIFRPVALFNERQDNATKWLRSIRDVIQSSRVYQRVYADRIPPGIARNDSRTLPRYWKWNDAEIDLAGKRTGEVEATISAHGVESATTGGHWPKMILDDLISVKHQQSQVEMERARAWLTNHVYLMRPAEGSLAYVNCTPWTYTDIYVDCVRDYKYRLYRRSALENSEGRPDVANGQPIFPQKLSREKLVEMHKRNPFSFNSQMMCVPVPGEHQSFSQEWMKFGEVVAGPDGEPAFVIDEAHYSKTARNVVQTEEPAPRMVPLHWMNKVIIMDPAPTEKTEQRTDPHARTAILVEGIDPWGRRFILESWADRLGYEAIIAKVFELSTKWATQQVWIEEVNFSNVYRHWIQREQRRDGKFPGHYLQPMILKPNKREKHARILAREPAWREGLYFLNRDGTLPFQIEFVEYPNSQTIDLLDCMGYDTDALQRPETSDEMRRRRALDRKGGPYSEPYFTQLPVESY